MNLWNKEELAARKACSRATSNILKDRHLVYVGPPPVITGPWLLSKPHLCSLITSLITLAGTVIDAFENKYKGYLTFEALWATSNEESDTIEKEFLQFWAASSPSHQEITRVSFDWLLLARKNPEIGAGMPFGLSDVAT